MTTTYPRVYKTKDSAAIIENLSSVFGRIKNWLEAMPAGPDKMSLVRAFEGGAQKGQQKKIVYQFDYGSAEVFHEGVYTHSVPKTASLADYFLGVADAARREENKDAYKQEMEVVRENFERLGESFGLCARMKKNEDGMVMPYYTYHGVWDSDLETIAFLGKMDRLVAAAKEERPNLKVMPDSTVPVAEPSIRAA